MFLRTFKDNNTNPQLAQVAALSFSPDGKLLYAADYSVSHKGIYAFDDLVVLKTAKMPAVLLECGVIVNRAEEEQLNNPAYRKRLVGAIGRAVQEFAQRASSAAKNN